MKKTRFAYVGKSESGNIPAGALLLLEDGATPEKITVRWCSDEEDHALKQKMYGYANGNEGQLDISVLSREELVFSSVKNWTMAITLEEKQ